MIYDTVDSDNQSSDHVSGIISARKTKKRTQLLMLQQQQKYFEA